MERLPNLTAKQHKFLSGLSQGMTQTEAARQAGYAFPAVAAAKLMQSGTLRQYNRAILEGAGVTPERIAEGIMDGIMAMRSFVVVVDGAEGRARRKEIVEADYDARIKFLELAVKMMGLVPERERAFSPCGEEQSPSPLPLPPPPAPPDSPLLELKGKELLTALQARVRELRSSPHGVT